MGLLTVALSFALGTCVSSIYYVIKVEKALKEQANHSYRSGYNHCVYVGGRRKI